MPYTDRRLFHPSVTSVPAVTNIDDLHIEASHPASTRCKNSGQLQKPTHPFQRVLVKHCLSQCSAILWSVLACALFFIFTCVTGAMAASVTLAWDANDPVPDGYRLFRRVENQAYNYSQPVWSGSGTTCTLDGFSDGTTYYFVVRAYVAQDESGDSNEVAYKTAATTNEAPLADAGANQTVVSQSSVTLNGRGSSDPEGQSLMYQWRQTSGTLVSLSRATTARPTFTAPNVTNQVITLAFELTVTDTGGLSSADTCLVLVKPATTTIDPDSDGDGVADSQDAFPNDPEEWIDTDSDGTGNNADSDDDNDGMPDEWETQYGLDPLYNNANDDWDGDGITDLEEYLSGSNPILDESNRAPNQPSVLYPGNDASNIELTPRLQSSEFSDPDEGDLHTATQWRITDATGGSIVLDTMCTNKAMERMRVPRLVLSTATKYKVYVRHFDHAGEPSDWSTAVTFTTVVDRKDKDGNGVPDNQEVDALSDLNADGIADIDQDTLIKSVTSITTDGQDLQMAVAVETEASPYEIEAVEAVDPSSLDSPLPETLESLPYGLLAYKIRVAEPGQATTVRLYFSNQISQDTQWVRYSSDGTWQAFTESTAVDDSGYSAERLITDGGSTDDDGVANGTIVELIGPRSATATTDGDSGAGLTDADTAPSGGTGGGAGCFLQSLMK
jgi:chitinase